MLWDLSAPSADNVPVGPSVTTGVENFKIKTGHIMMVQASPLCGKANDDGSWGRRSSSGSMPTEVQ
jgi:hypothetical protein